MLKNIYIKNIKTENNLFLAPMCGITDFPFREMIQKYENIGLMYTEMIPSRSIYQKNYSKKVKSNFKIKAVQISGNDPYYMSEASKLNEDLGADLIDLNFGCPVKKVVKGFAGSALMKDEKLSRKIIKSVIKSVKIPITIKMRIGWDESNLNAPTISKIAEDEGVSLITIHCRTRSQMYSGKANWKFASKIKDIVKIPIIVNGDIKNTNDVINALEVSRADGVMIGRGVYGCPWIFKKISYELQGKIFEEPTIKEKGQVLLEHFNKIIDYYGEKIGIPVARKHISWYSVGMKNCNEFKNSINQNKNLNDIKNMIIDFFNI